MIRTERLVHHAARLLSVTADREVDLVEPVLLESESTVIRARVEPPGPELPSAVIVKFVEDTTFDQAGHQGPPQRFLNEWATLSFISSLGLDTEVCPRFLVGDEDPGLLVMADLGELPNLERLLLGERDARAREGVIEMGRSLGRLQLETHGRESDFRTAQESLRTASPRCDSTVDQRGREEVFQSCLEAMGLTPVPRFWDSVGEVESEIHDDTPFWSMIHGDAGPQNLLLTRGRGVWIDFEYAVYRNGLCDVVGARLGFPQTTMSMSVPEESVRGLETAYRDTICEAIPQAEDDESFFRALTAAAAHWALNRWAASWRNHVGRTQDAVQDLDVATLSRTLLVLDGFTGLAEESGSFAEVAATVESYTRELRRRWPDLERTGVYPALRNG